MKENGSPIEEIALHKENVVPYIQFWDLGCYGDTKNIIKIANVQMITTLSGDTPPKLEDEESQKEKIFRYINESIDHNSDLIVLSELSTSPQICEKIFDEFSESDMSIVMGSYYDGFNQNVSNILVNKDCKGQTKNNPSEKEKNFMNKGTSVNVFINTSVGDFAVLICYDATDLSILTALQDYTDFIICIARNKDVSLFDNMFRALTYLKYQYIIFCNDGKYGGSSFYAPFKENRKLDTLGVNNEGILYRKLDLKEIDELRGCRDKHKFETISWKYPPASTESRNKLYPNTRIKYGVFKRSSFDYMNCQHEIFKRFLSSVYNNLRSTEQIRIDGKSFSGIQCMYPPDLNGVAKSLEPIILSKFLKYKLQKTSPGGDDINDDELFKRLQASIYGRCYLLFEIDCENLKREASSNFEYIKELLKK